MGQESQATMFSVIASLFHARASFLGFKFQSLAGWIKYGNGEFDGQGSGSDFNTNAGFNPPFGWVSPHVNTKTTPSQACLPLFPCPTLSSTKASVGFYTLSVFSALTYTFGPLSLEAHASCHATLRLYFVTQFFID